MKNISRLALLIACLTTKLFWAQPAPPANATPVTFNFGFNNFDGPLSPQTVKWGTNTIITNNHLYFISASNSKIWEIYWDPTLLTWVPSPGNLGGSPVPAVKTGTNIVNNGDELFFVGTDSKIYSLKWNSSTGWLSTQVYPTQVLVSGTNISLSPHPSGIAIFYVGTTGKVYQLYLNGTSWSGGGAQLSSAQSVNAITASPLICGAAGVYFVGTDNKVYRVYWGGSSWVGGNAPLVASSTALRLGSKIITETNDSDHLYYVNASNQVCELVNTGGWSYTILGSGVNVRVNTDIICSFGNIFYVNSSTNNLYGIKKIGSVWSSAILAAAESVKTGTQIFGWANDIIEEGTASTTFKSHHIFYTGANHQRMNVLVYDDPICAFRPSCCEDHCDADDDENGWEQASGDPLDPLTDPGCIYNCASCIGLSKVWYMGSVPRTAGLHNFTTNNGFNIYNKHFFYIGVDSKIHDFLRGPSNGLLKPQFSPSTTTWKDDFDGTALNTSVWFKGEGGHPSDCYNQYYTFPSAVTVGGGNLNITSKNTITSPPIGNAEHLPFTATLSHWPSPYNPACYPPPGSDGTFTMLETYKYSTGEINTKVNNVDYEPYFTPNPQIKTGYIESRFKIARGKGFWTTFFLYNGGGADMNFEFEGNGKVFITTFYDTDPSWDRGALTTYAVGYRFYDNYYTYAIDWKPDGSVVYFYFNNELIGGWPNTEDPRGGHSIIYRVEIDDNVRAACEATLYDVGQNSVYSVDYFRLWNANPIFRSPTTSIPEEQNNMFTIAPNPSRETITIKGGQFESVVITNMQGVTVLESASETINVEHLSAGVYIAKVTDLNGKVNNLKFIKQ